MPLTKKGQKIESAMKSEYGEKEGKKVFYASRNAGTISGVDTEIHEGLPVAGMFTSRPHGGFADQYNGENDNYGRATMDATTEPIPASGNFTARPMEKEMPPNQY